MIGFFEHQYLSYKKNHIKSLLALAKVDGHMHEKELELLFKIGKRYGLKDRQIQELVDSNEAYSINIPDNHNDKMDLLYDLILMVHADEVIDKHEVIFCEDVVNEFGMRRELVQWMLDSFKQGIPLTPEEWETMKKEALYRFTKDLQL